MTELSEKESVPCACTNITQRRSRLKSLINTKFGYSIETTDDTVPVTVYDALASPHKQKNGKRQWLKKSSQYTRMKYGV